MGVFRSQAQEKIAKKHTLERKTMMIAAIFLLNCPRLIISRNAIYQKVFLQTIALYKAYHNLCKLKMRLSQPNERKIE